MLIGGNLYTSTYSTFVKGHTWYFQLTGSAEEDPFPSQCMMQQQITVAPRGEG